MGQLSSGNIPPAEIPLPPSRIDPPPALALDFLGAAVDGQGPQAAPSCPMYSRDPHLEAAMR
jgi:hypothetical protein